MVAISISGTVIALLGAVLLALVVGTALTVGDRLARRNQRPSSS